MNFEQINSYGLILQLDKCRITKNECNNKLVIILVMDKIWNPSAWPKPLHQNLPIAPQILSTRYSVTPTQIPQKFLQYLLSICHQKQTPIQLIQLTLSIASRYLSQNSMYQEPMQLVLLGCLFVAGKVLGDFGVEGHREGHRDGGGFGINDLHRFSNHCFTNRDFYRIEKKILEEVKFDVLAQGICDRQVKTILVMLRQILNESHYQTLIKVTQDIQKILWYNLYTKPDPQKFLKNPQKQPATSPSTSSNKPQRLLTASIIQSALILCTHCVGRFPATVWMIHVLELKEDQLSLLVEEVLKVVLGREKFQELKI